MKILLEKTMTGPILDIGGGGEGVIGRIYRQQVIAIDNCQQELDEAPDVCEKRLMDAAALDFEDGTFDHVTAFYALMYMTAEEQCKAIGEAFRVLKPGGTLHIWDAVISCAYPDPFVVDLDIDAAGTRIHTTYGVVKTDAQDDALFKDICRKAGLVLVSQELDGGHFYLQFCKSGSVKTPSRQK